LKLGKKISGGVRDEDARLCYLELTDERLEINTLRHGAQWYTGLLDLEELTQTGKHAVPIDDLLKVVERLETESLTIRDVAGKIKVQGGRRYGTVPALESEFPISSIGDDAVDGYEGPNEFASTIRGLCSVGIDGVNTIWGAVRLGDDGRAGSTDSGNLLWTPLPLLNGTNREVLIPIGSFAPIANMIGDIKVRLTKNFIEVTSERGVYRCTLLDKDPPPYISLVNQRTEFETLEFPLAKLIAELEAFAKTVSTGADVLIKNGKMTVSTVTGSTVEFNSTTEIEGQLKCKFHIRNPKNFLPVAKLLKGSCEVFKGETSHLTLKAEETIVIVSCWEDSLSFG